jgi:cytochrome c-type biogenesis protein CcmH/NrfF
LNNRLRSAIHGALVALFMVTASSMQASADRAETIGEGLICMCGCHQLLSGCEMIACSAAPGMRKEVRQHIEEGKDDKTILAAFREKYGPKVLSAPKTDNWFDLSAWLMPFAVFGASALAVVFALKKLKTNTPAGEAAPPDVPSPRDREIEEELKKFTPED